MQGLSSNHTWEKTLGLTHPSLLATLNDIWHTFWIPPKRMLPLYWKVFLVIVIFSLNLNPQKSYILFCTVGVESGIRSSQCPVTSNCHCLLLSDAPWAILSLILYILMQDEQLLPLFCCLFTPHLHILDSWFIFIILVEAFVKTSSTTVSAVVAALTEVVKLAPVS